MKLFKLLTVLLLSQIALNVQASPREGTPTTAKVGSSAPDFALKDEAGKEVKLSDFKGKAVVLQWTNADCPFIKRHYDLKTTEGLVSKYVGKDVVFLAIDSSNFATQEKLSAVKREKGLNYALLEDSAGVVGQQYGAKTTPHVYVIDTKGVLVYQGAMDNDPRGELETGRVNYADQALTEILSGKPVTVAETKPYGCSVKYKS